MCKHKKRHSEIWNSRFIFVWTEIETTATSNKQVSRFNVTVSCFITYFKFKKYTVYPSLNSFISKFVFLRVSVVKWSKQLNYIITNLVTLCWSPNVSDPFDSMVLTTDWLWISIFILELDDPPNTPAFSIKTYCLAIDWKVWVMPLNTNQSIIMLRMIWKKCIWLGIKKDTTHMWAKLILYAHSNIFYSEVDQNLYPNV